MKTHLISYFLVILVIVCSCSKDDSSKNNAATSVINVKIGKSQTESFSKQLRVDNAIYIVGTTTNTKKQENDYDTYKGGYRDILVSKIASNGKLEWTKCYGTNKSDYAINAYEHKGAIILVGNTNEEVAINGLGSVQGSSSIRILAIDKNGEELWNKSLDKSGDQYPKIVVKLDNQLRILYSGNLSTKLHEAKFDIDKKELISDQETDLNIKYPTLKECTDGYMIFGKYENEVKVYKFNKQFNTEWSNTISYCSSIKDAVKVEDGYIFTGTTKSYYYGKYPYTQITSGFHSDYEVFICRTDNKGNCDYKKGSKQWKIGVGYLENNWNKNGEYGIGSDDYDCGQRITKLDNGSILIFGVGTQHKDNPGIIGGTKDYNTVQTGALFLNFDANYTVNDSNPDDAYMGWIDDFYKKQLKFKRFDSSIVGLTEVIKETNRYVFISSNEGNIIVKSYSKSEIE